MPDFRMNAKNRCLFRDRRIRLLPGRQTGRKRMDGLHRSHRSNSASSGGGILIMAGHTDPPIIRFRMISGKRLPSHPKKLVKAFPRSIIELSVILTTKRFLLIPVGKALLVDHLKRAIGKLVVRMILVTTTPLGAVVAGVDGSKIKKTFQVLDNLSGRVVEMTKDRFLIDFR
jgi:hypothetical protein